MKMYHNIFTHKIKLRGAAKYIQLELASVPFHKDKECIFYFWLVHAWQVRPSSIQLSYGVQGW